MTTYRCFVNAFRFLMASGVALKTCQLLCCFMQQSNKLLLFMITIHCIRYRQWHGPFNLSIIRLLCRFSVNRLSVGRSLVSFLLFILLILLNLVNFLPYYHIYQKRYSALSEIEFVLSTFISLLLTFDLTL